MGCRWTTNGIRIQKIQTACLTLFVLAFEVLGHSSSLNSEGLALLSFRKRVTLDPFSALSDWNPINSHHCKWPGVQCEDNKVQVLYLSGLLLEGTLAPELGNLTNLKSLILSNNHFSGVIPKQFGQLAYLEVLDLRNNDLFGQIPTEIEQLFFLKRLLLYNNNFEGNIPAEIGNLNLLNDVEFDANLTHHLGEGFYCLNRKIVKCERLDGINLLRKVDSTSIPIEGTINDKRGWSASIDSHDSLPSITRSHVIQDVHEDNEIGASLSRRLGEESMSSSNNLEAALIDIEEPLNLIYHQIEGSSGSFSAIPIFKHTFSPPPPIASIPAAQSPDHKISSSAPEQNTSTTKTPDHTVNSSTTKKYISGIGGGAFLLITFVAILFFGCRQKASRAIIPWKTGLSGQLQNALVKGVPKLNRSELETACEDFSNIVQTNDQIIIYKGTLSNSTQIVVVSTTIPSIKEWTQRSQIIFRKMINTMSRVNHKNFLNLIGYCEEDECFSRMMVFEYALNGTLAEHLQDVKDLDWGTRMKIGMGICYCLQYMHNLNPPIPHSNVNSGVIYLTEEFTAKIGEVCFWSDFLRKSNSSHHISTESCELPSHEDIETNVYDFGIILLELLSGKPAHSRDGGSLMDWASQHLNDKNSYKHIADLSLKSFKESEFTVICEVIHDCTQLDAKKRPNMNEITSKLRSILDISPESATSRLSPLWWAELEILSSESI